MQQRRFSGAQPVSSSRDGAGLSSSGTRTMRFTRKRPRLACMDEPLQRHVYELMVRQLHYDGYTDAAASVATSTGVIVPNLTAGNYQRAGMPPCRDSSMYSSVGGVGDRLIRLVSNGIALESTQALEMKTFLAREVVERHIASSKLYLPFYVSEHSTIGKTALNMRERFTTSSLGGVVRAVEFSPDGSLVACGGTNGLAAIFSLTTLNDLTALEELRQEMQWGRLNGGLSHDSSRSAPEGGAVGVNSRGSATAAAGEQGPESPPSSLASIRASNNASNVITELSEVRRFHEHEQSVEVVRFHASQPYLLTGGYEGDLYLRDYSQPRSKVLLRHHDAFPIRSACFHPSVGSSSTTTSTGGISSAEYIMYVTDHVAPRMLNVETQSVLMPLAYSAPGGPHMTGSATAALNSAGSGSNTQPHTAALCDIDMSRDGRCFATASMDGSFALHDAVSGRTVLRAMAVHSGVPVTSIVFSRTGNILLTSGMDSTARLWDLRRFRCSWAADTATTGSSSMRLRRSSPSRAGDEEVHPDGTAATTAAGEGGEVAPSSNPSGQPSISSSSNDAKPRVVAASSGGGAGWISSGSVTELMSFGEPEKCSHRSMCARFSSHESHVWCHDASLFALHCHSVVTGDVSQSIVVARHAQRGFAAAPFANAVLVSGADDCRVRLWTPTWMPS